MRAHADRPRTTEAHGGGHGATPDDGRHGRPDVAHGDHDAHAGHDAHGDHDAHAGHSVGMFRDRFWLSVLLTVPVLVWSEMIQEWFGFTAPVFAGSDRIPLLFGTAVFVYGGRRSCAAGSGRSASGSRG